MDWVLILTLYATGLSVDAGGPAVAAVGGFESQELCLAAGNAWLKKQRRVGAALLANIDSNAICVPQRKKEPANDR